MQQFDMKWREFFGSTVSIASTLLAFSDELCSTDELDSHEFSSTLNEIQRLHSSGSDNRTDIPRSDVQMTSVVTSRDQQTIGCEKCDVIVTTDVSDVDSSRGRPGCADCWRSEGCQLNNNNLAYSSFDHLGMEKPEIFQPEVDKKRPLSVASSCSSSSAGSLICHFKKKTANGIIATSLPSSDLNNSGEGLSTVDEGSPAGGNLCPAGSCEICSCHADSCHAGSSDTGSCHTSSCDTGSCHTMFDGRSSCCDSEYQCVSDGGASLDDKQRIQGGPDVEMKRDGQSGAHPSGVAGPGGGSYIDRVVLEILETEKAYVTDLSDIVYGYVNYVGPLTAILTTASDKEALFGNIEEIYLFNRRFLCDLEACMRDPVAIASCFVGQRDEFQIYADYCKNFPRSMEVLTRFMRDESISTAFKLLQLRLHHSLPLGSYFLKPVQRILKYHLLLLNIYEHYDASSPGYDVIGEAVDAMTKVARWINEMKSQHEHTVRIQEVQSLLTGWNGDDLTTLGELLLEDKFRICGAKAQRQIFMFKEGLLITKRKEDGTFLVKDFIKTSNLMLIESVPREPCCFHIVPFDSPKMQLTVQARNMSQKRSWCQQIKKLILDNYSVAIPDKIKELVMTLGKSREDEETTSMNHSELYRKQYSVPEYLERWQNRRKSAGFLSAIGLKKNVTTENLNIERHSRSKRRNSEGVLFFPDESPWNEKPNNQLLKQTDKCTKKTLAGLQEIHNELDINQSDKKRAGSEFKHPIPESELIRCNVCKDNAYRCQMESTHNSAQALSTSPSKIPSSLRTFAFGFVKRRNSETTFDNKDVLVRRAEQEDMQRVNHRLRVPDTKEFRSCPCKNADDVCSKYVDDVSAKYSIFEERDGSSYGISCGDVVSENERKEVIGCDGCTEVDNKGDAVISKKEGVTFQSEYVTFECNEMESENGGYFRSEFPTSGWKKQDGKSSSDTNINRIVKRNAPAERNDIALDGFGGKVRGAIAQLLAKFPRHATGSYDVNPSPRYATLPSKIGKKEKRSGDFQQKVAAGKIQQKVAAGEIQQKVATGEFQQKVASFFTKLSSGRAGKTDVPDNSFSDENVPGMQKMLTALLKDAELGGEGIGERIAVATPQTLDRTLTITVTNQQKAKKQHKVCTGERLVVTIVRDRPSSSNQPTCFEAHTDDVFRMDCSDESNNDVIIGTNLGSCDVRNPEFADGSDVRSPAFVDGSDDGKASSSLDGYDIINPASLVDGDVRTPTSVDNYYDVINKTPVESGDDVRCSTCDDTFFSTSSSISLPVDGMDEGGGPEAERIDSEASYYESKLCEDLGDDVMSFVSNSERTNSDDTVFDHAL